MVYLQNSLAILKIGTRVPWATCIYIASVETYILPLSHPYLNIQSLSSIEIETQGMYSVLLSGVLRMIRL